MLVLLEHTWHHLHFTWRTLVVTLIGILLYLFHARDELTTSGHAKARPYDLRPRQGEALQLKTKKNNETHCGNHTLLE